ncbi:hypothetical protein ACFZAC_02150 [Pseudomonas fluorescens]|uniref:hypothetical protein n=2 Tax=Pseudomonas TaxID=286 RepID=UPI0037487C71
MATSAQRVFTPRIRNNQGNNFIGTIDGVAYKANSFRLTENSLPGTIGPHWEARVHQRAVDFSYKEISIYIPKDTIDGTHPLNPATKIIISYVDYSDTQNPIAHKSVGGNIDFTLDKDAKVFSGNIDAVMDSNGGDGGETFKIEVENFLILGT